MSPLTCIYAESGARDWLFGPPGQLAKAVEPAYGDLPALLYGAVSSALLSTIFNGTPKNGVNTFKLFDYRLHSAADHGPEKASSSIGLSIKGCLVGRSPLSHGAILAPTSYLVRSPARFNCFSKERLGAEGSSRGKVLPGSAGKSARADVTTPVAAALAAPRV